MNGPRDLTSSMNACQKTEWGESFSKWRRTQVFVQLDKEDESWSLNVWPTDRHKRELTNNWINFIMNTWFIKQRSSAVLCLVFENVLTDIFTSLTHFIDLTINQHSQKIERLMAASNARHFQAYHQRAAVRLKQTFCKYHWAKLNDP